MLIATRRSVLKRVELQLKKNASDFFLLVFSSMRSADY